MKPYFHAAARVLLFIGGNLLAGSALAFAALNQGARVQDGAFFYWQRYFVDNIVATATLPGIALLVIGSLLLCLAENQEKTSVAAGGVAGGRRQQPAVYSARFAPSLRAGVSVCPADCGIRRFYRRQKYGRPPRGA